MERTEADAVRDAVRRRSLLDASLSAIFLSLTVLILFVYCRVFLFAEHCSTLFVEPRLRPF